MCTVSPADVSGKKRKMNGDEKEEGLGGKL
jgi:hypothetical protein